MTTPGDYPPPSDSGGGYGPGGYGPGGYGPGGSGAPQQANNTPTVLSIIGIVCWFLCSPAAIVLGFVGQSKARQYGQSDTLPKVTWIGGICFLVIGIVVNIVVRMH